MPAFNAAKFIGEAVDSVIAQTWQRWELIIVDDGSTDETGAILKGLCDPRITVVTQSNRGVSAARNAGLALATGQYLTFLDADDTLPPASLEVRAEFLERHPGIGIVDGRISVRDACLGSVLRVYTPYYTGTLLPRLLALDDRVFFGPFYMVRSAQLTDVKFLENMSHAEDLLFFTRLAAMHSLQYSFVAEEIYNYRTGQISAMSNVEGLEEGYLVFMWSVFSTIKVSAFQAIFLRGKIAKILFLTWARKGNYLRAIKSIFKCLPGGALERKFL